MVASQEWWLRVRRGGREGGEVVASEEWWSRVRSGDRE